MGFLLFAMVARCCSSVYTSMDIWLPRLKDPAYKGRKVEIAQ